MIIKLTNKSKNFYSHLGRIFGSREVERKTGDRFYDDDDKVWYVYYYRGKPDTFVSVQKNVIKNVWSENKEHLRDVLKEIKNKENVKTSVVPIVYKDVYQEAGFEILGNGYRNFIKIRGVEE